MDVFNLDDMTEAEALTFLMDVLGMTEGQAKEFYALHIGKGGKDLIEDGKDAPRDGV